MMDSSAQAIARYRKEQCRQRRKALFKSAEAMVHLEDAKVYIEVRRANTYYVYDSERPHDWLPLKGPVRPLYRPSTAPEPEKSLQGNHSTSTVHESIAGSYDKIRTKPLAHISRQILKPPVFRKYTESLRERW
ncbi:hypothetical protein ABVK25_010797 [Lepraria finkii]|uniref:MADS-box domain-containing protein n=1 Tax=Lepraria finkii TaxID=1340010 RepID=A0ABR4ATB2_9LECA